MIKIRCKICKNIFKVPNYKKERKFCSNSCYGKSRLGIKCKPFSIKHRRNIGLASIGRINGAKNPKWKGGKRITWQGYILLYNPKHPYRTKQNAVPEHRLVIEKQINRYLLPYESAHHLGAKGDNRPKMLMAFTSESAHQRFHHDPNNVKKQEIIFNGHKIHA